MMGVVIHYSLETQTEQSNLIDRRGIWRDQDDELLSQRGISPPPFFSFFENTHCLETKSNQSGITSLLYIGCSVHIRHLTVSERVGTTFFLYCISDSLYFFYRAILYGNKSGGPSLLSVQDIACLHAICSFSPIQLIPPVISFLPLAEHYIEYSI